MALEDVKSILWLSCGIPEFYIVSLFEQISQWRIVISILHCLPINFLKKLMFLQILNGDSFIWVFLQETKQNISELKTHSSNFAVYFLINKILLDHLFIVLHAELGLPFILNQNLFELQLKHQHSHGPQICTLIKSSIDYLWRHIFNRAKESSNSFGYVSLKQNFRQAIVCKFEVSVISNEYVFWFELPVNDAMFVQKLDGDNDLGEHVSDGVLWEEEVLFFGVEVEISFGQVLHDNVDVFFILEYLGYIGEKRMPADSRDKLGLQQVELVYLCFGNYLHRETHIA